MDEEEEGGRTTAQCGGGGGRGSVAGLQDAPAHERRLQDLRRELLQEGGGRRVEWRGGRGVWRGFGEPQFGGLLATRPD